MVSINGISIENIQNTLGHEGEVLASATVYKDGEEIGLWRQGDYGGSDEFFFDSSLIAEAVREFKERMPMDTPVQKINRQLFNTSIFMAELLELTCTKMSNDN